MNLINKIYLAGTVYSDENDKNWKHEFIKYLGHPERYFLFDPNPKKNFDPLKLGLVNYDVISYDKRAIDNSDILVAYIQQPSFGTAMEICHAFEKHNITIYVINPNRKYEHDIWLTHHCNMFFTSVEDCANQINMIYDNIVIHIPYSNSGEK